MSEPPKPAPDKEAPKPKSSDEERLRVIQQYIDGLKEFLRKLGKHLH